MAKSGAGLADAVSEGGVCQVGVEPHGSGGRGAEGLPGFPVLRGQVPSPVCLWTLAEFSTSVSLLHGHRPGPLWMLLMFNK